MSSEARSSTKVLVLNAGSSSLKWLVLDAVSEAIEAHGEASWEGTEGGRHERELASALQRVPQVQAVGHRVVHGGSTYRDATLVDDAVRARILELAELAPLHNPAAVAGIDAARARFPDVPQVATFDTAFHATIPQVAALYPLPWEWTSAWGLRRFGFHGLSVEYAVGRVTQLLGSLPARLVVAHLGAGCSVTAVANGRSIETSMGFTPLEGLMMARRSGSVDPGMLLYLMAQQKVSLEQLDEGLNERSGLLGVSGVSADLRQVLADVERGNARARLARDMFVYRGATTIGAMAASLGGLDALVFTGGIGEHSAAIRSAVCERLAYLGLDLDLEANGRREEDQDVASPASGVRVLVTTAREDLSVLRGVRRVLDW